MVIKENFPFSRIFVNRRFSLKVSVAVVMMVTSASGTSN